MSTVLGGRVRAGSKVLAPQYDQEGNEIKVETREDEEQQVKLDQTIELLLAAGYFRARIKGLSPFDKVVGGMTWCITTCNFDLDVDLLFQENSTIGQKIALTEKIVAVLPKMKCPHRIEPHQIQGLDFIHIYPVVQWLVKRAIETREEMGDQIRAFSVSQFNKNHRTPEDQEFDSRKEQSVSTLAAVKTGYQPRRQYKRQDISDLLDEESRVHSTLLEYGSSVSKRVMASSSSISAILGETLTFDPWRYGYRPEKADKAEGKDSAKSAVAAALGGKTEEMDEEEAQALEEQRIKALMSGMQATGAADGKLTASAVGSIVGMQSAEIQQIASEYAGKQAELAAEDRPERLSGAQQHKRTVASLNKQIATQEKKLEEVRAKHEELHSAYTSTQEKLQEVEEFSAKLDEEMEKLSEQEKDEANSSVLQQLRGLVAMNENLKKQEQEFRAHCKEEMARLQGAIDQLKLDGAEGEGEDQERSRLIEKQHQADKEKLHKIRLLLARKNREIAQLQRKIDEVPSRAELSQYQRRFVELYNQVAATHKETKQFITLYNTLDDTKLYLNKEVNLLNSIHDNFEQAMSSAANKEQFLKQLEQIVDGIKQNKNKVEKKKQEEKMRRDQLNDTFLDLVDKQRVYFKTVKDFQEECRKNEILLAKLKAAS
ncbi:coiled-coil domain-containing protein 93-like isoform X2 [Branchiostoma floridae]|uniref:Coiled-coil domain-containing protein 93 n=1 Tax=Branchiostoma floridae TaxID=7739 RepID=A0A9J7LUE1_BRAFL|nr:coiled-coil domain-containing protein 93-like isoform X2 [Branchiostoma floridae]